MLIITVLFPVTVGRKKKCLLKIILAAKLLVNKT